jgi:UPF0755 protein
MTRKRGRGAIIGVFLTALVIFGIIYGAWSTITTVFAPPVATHSGPITLAVKEGETTAQIADDLYAHSLIRNPLAFRIWARVKGLDTQLHAGAYILTPGMSIDRIVAKLLQQQPDEKRLAVIDGWRLEQIAAQTAALGLVNVNSQDFSKYIHHPDQFPDRARYAFLQKAPSMEGLLFPDTYLIPLNYNTVQVIDLMLDEFTRVVQQYNLAPQAQQHQLALYTMVVLASIVQREAANTGQMPLIAGIYWKRINQPSLDVGGPLLAADPTVQYARDSDKPPTTANGYWGPLDNTGGQVDPGSRWNTYTHQGWPPTPIASPGLDALKAAASPAQTNCYYFFSKQDGSLVCAPTYAQILQKE